jgi:hypothetical protein
VQASWLTRLPSVLALAALIALADHLTGPHTRFPGMYSVPIALAGWYHGIGWALAIGLGSAAAGYLFQVGLVPPLGLAIDTGSRLLGGLILAFFVHRARLYERSLETRVQNLEGILPICAHCHKIRDAGGQWQRLERYIADRSQAEFSHGICPDCVTAHYAEQ